MSYNLRLEAYVAATLGFIYQPTSMKTTKLIRWGHQKHRKVIQVKWIEKAKTT